MPRPSSRDVVIRGMSFEDWPSVRDIYTAGIATGNATFETVVPDWEQWDAAHLSCCRLVACAPEVSGWAALSAVSRRAVYRGVAEVSVYVAASAYRRGIGLKLLSGLVLRSEEAGIWTLQAGIFRENAPSIALHERCGFRVVGVRKRLGCLRGAWRDVVLMERRSNVVGV